MLSEKVGECGKNPKMLYRLINNILGTNAANPLQASTSDETLANEFADFFMNKIQKICDALDKNPKYNPCSKEVVSLDSFKLLSEKRVKYIISSMSAKSCELDVRPTQLLKDILEVVEKSVLIQFNNHCDENDLMPDYQSAYRPNHSCG